MSSPAEERIVPEARVPRWDAHADVVVVGLGCAGASTAIEAARAGAETLVLERASGGGGTTGSSGGVLYCGGGTSVQKACGFDDSPDEMFAYLRASTGPAPDLEKLRIYCERSVEHFEWLRSLAIPFKASYWPHNFEPWTDDCLWYSGSEEAHPYRELARPAPRGHTVQAEGSCAGGPVLMHALEQALRTAGAEVATDVRVLSLVRAGDGGIVGVVGRHAGRDLHLRARRGVVLATGGFVANRGLVARHAPQALALEPLGGAGDDGSGIELGRAAGAECLNLSAMAYTCPVLVPFELIRGILVNRHGQRFVNEDVNHKRIGEELVLRQEGRMFLVVDAESFARPSFPGIELVASGESPGELEAELGLPPLSLAKTLELYNAHAAQGRDPLFGKRAAFLRPLASPPYGTFDCSVGSGAPVCVFTLGVLWTAPGGDVRRPDGAAIPGLFAAGRSTSCLSAQSCGSSGLQIGEGTFFGRLAGQAAARERA